MATTAAEVVSEAQALLNDAAGVNYTLAALLPFIKKAYDELLQSADIHKAPDIKEISGILTVLPNKVIINAAALSAGTFPADLFEPLEIKERAAGSITGTLFDRMKQEPWEPDIKTDEILRYWNWREEEIKTPGSTSSREILIYYIKTLPVIVDGTTAIPVARAKTYLAARVASLGARHIGENYTRADILALDANAAKEDLKNQWAHRRQAMPIRRMGYGIGRRYGR